ncbi:MAG: putative dehydrogenase [Patiriisocius sp.]|jgi:predicted dehydrogenase
MISFGILGAADIAPLALIHPCMNEPRATVSVIGARSRDSATGFARYHKIPNVVDNYADLIHHESCNAIYNPLPISHHLEWSTAALQAGKHVLCEKSMASNAEQARLMATAAADSGLILMDAFHYRYHPLFIHAKEIYDSGDLGQIQSIDAAFSVSGITNPDDIRLNFATAGGVTMDIGCYPISWVRHLSGAEPDDIIANAIVGPPNVDLMLEASMKLPGDIQASIIGDMRPNGKFRADIMVTGSLGTMTVHNPLAPQMGHRLTTEVGGDRQDLTFDRRPSYSYQLDAFIQAVKTGTPPLTDGEDAVKQMMVIDQCYMAAGLPLRGAANA